MKTMKTIKIIIGLFVMVVRAEAHTVNVKNYVEYPFVVDFLHLSSTPHATMAVKAGKPEKPTSDERDIGAWCTNVVRVTIKKPDGGYGGEMRISTLPYGIGVAATCSSFDVFITKTPNNDIKVTVSSKSAIVETKEETYPLADLLKSTTENSIIANKTTGQIKLYNAPSLGTGATGGVPIYPGQVIPFYLNAGSTGEELVIKGSGAGTVSFGNDYANYKTTLIKSKNISGLLPYDSNGNFIRKGLTSQGYFVIDPFQRLDINTPPGEWEITFKVAEKI